MPQRASYEPRPQAAHGICLRCGVLRALSASPKPPHPLSAQVANDATSAARKSQDSLASLKGGEEHYGGHAQKYREFAMTVGRGA
eukprot:2347481-Amphidinium_carterae.1